MTVLGTALMGMSMINEEARPMAKIGGAVVAAGFIIKISSLSNLKKSANYLIKFK